VRFRKSEGLNASEKLLAELCEHSFLKLWTYPNLFRKPGKELTDLMVVFGNDVILFSAKACTYPNSGDPVIDWSRWFRSSIADSAKQIVKAEKSIQAAPDKVFLDAKCLEKLPIALPAAGDIADITLDDVLLLGLSIIGLDSFRHLIPLCSTRSSHISGRRRPHSSKIRELKMIIAKENLRRRSMSG